MDGEIDPDEVASRLDDDGLCVVDVRSPGAFARGHIPGSVNVPFDELPGRVDELADAEHVVTVCPHGKASVQAARLVASFEGAGDARVESMAGGLEAYAGALSTRGASDPDGDADGSADADPAPDAPF
jgi:rhodanese-related sulfurtransferase